MVQVTLLESFYHTEGKHHITFDRLIHLICLNMLMSSFFLCSDGRTHTHYMICILYLTKKKTKNKAKKGKNRSVSCESGGQRKGEPTCGNSSRFNEIFPFGIRGNPFWKIWKLIF